MTPAEQLANTLNGVVVKWTRMGRWWECRVQFRGWLEVRRVRNKSEAVEREAIAAAYAATSPPAST